MIKNNFPRVIVCTLCFIVWISGVSAQTWPPAGMSGNGTSADPWQITAIGQMVWLANYVNVGNGLQTAGQNVKSAFSVFPDPTSNQLRITNHESQITSIEIVDVLGRVVLSQHSAENNITLDVSGYSSGVYFVRMTTEDGIKAEKFIKK